MTMTALNTARINQLGPPDMAGPGLAPVFWGLACGADAVGVPGESGVAGADTVGDEVADCGGAEVTGAVGGFDCPCWLLEIRTSHRPRATPMTIFRPFMTLLPSMNTPILQRRRPCG
jgi:hypothetical protein